MLNQLKKYLSFFFLLLFLFPTVEKQLHAFSHSADEHCTATDKHFHAAEHSCSICDFTITDTNVAPETDFNIIVSANHLSFQPFISNVHVPHTYLNIPPRAPPVLA